MLRTQETLKVFMNRTQRALHSLSAGSRKSTYSKSLGQQMLLERKSTEFLKKHGFIVNKLKILESMQGFKVCGEIFPRRYRGKKSAKEKAVSPADPKKLLAFEESWNFFSEHVLMKYITNGIPCETDLVLLHDSSLNKGAINKTPLQEETFNFRRYPFYEDGLCLLEILATRPGASLLANFIAQESDELHRPKILLDFLFKGLTFIIDLPASSLEGAIIEVKGRASGMERTHLVRYRRNSAPRQRIEDPLDFGFAEIYTSYGISGVKVWLNYKR